MRQIFVMVLLTTGGTPADGRPTSLRCLVDGASAPFQLTLDEDRAVAGASSKMWPAVFSRDKVEWAENFGTTLFISYSVDRKTLDVTTEAIPTGGAVDIKHGRCAVVEPKSASSTPL